MFVVAADAALNVETAARLGVHATLVWTLGDTTNHYQLKHMAAAVE